VVALALDGGCAALLAAGGLILRPWPLPGQLAAVPVDGGGRGG
jgi:hypothetical protein